MGKHTCWAGGWALSTAILIVAHTSLKAKCQVAAGHDASVALSQALGLGSTVQGYQRRPWWQLRMPRDPPPPTPTANGQNTGTSCEHAVSMVKHGPRRPSAWDTRPEFLQSSNNTVILFARVHKPQTHKPQAEPP